MRLLRVVVVDDHEMVRLGVVGLLGRDPGIEVVGTAADGEAALALLAGIEADVAVVDYQLPGMSGVELCERIVERHPEVAVVMLTGWLDDEVVRAALAAGARGYVYKDVEATELCRAVRAVGRGEAFLDPKVAGWVASWATGPRSVGGGERLAPREVEVLRLVAAGATNREIADALFITDNTVRTYLRRMMTKLDCHSRGEAAVLAARRGWL